MVLDLHPPKIPSVDQRLIHPDVSWSQFKLIQQGFAHTRKVHLFYFDHTIEILMPGQEHEFFKAVIGMLIELFCLETSTEFWPIGSATQEKEGEVSAEPDESYCFGTVKPVPDLVLEMVFTSGGSNKLQRYQAFGIPEVWFWQDGVFQLYALVNGSYQLVSGSTIPELKSLDIGLLSRCMLMAQTSRLGAAQTFRQGIQNA
ncbi:MAG: Uma2 family endonuclease [Cyanobacteria bacterium P01_F01_bin.150]